MLLLQKKVLNLTTNHGYQKKNTLLLKIYQPTRSRGFLRLFVGCRCLRKFQFSLNATREMELVSSSKYPNGYCVLLCFVYFYTSYYFCTFGSRRNPDESLVTDAEIYRAVSTHRRFLDSAFPKLDAFCHKPICQPIVRLHIIVRGNSVESICHRMEKSMVYWSKIRRIERMLRNLPSNIFNDHLLPCAMRCSAIATKD